MLHTEAGGLLVGTIALGAVHGIEPGHGWPIAASYALDRTDEWVHGLAASLIIGVGHLASSLAVVLLFFYAKGYFGLTRIDQPITLLGTSIGGPVSIVAGLLLVGLGVREYVHGHSHGDHSHGDHEHDHPQGGLEEPTDRGLLAIAWFAFVLGFAHEEEFEIIALCAGSAYCLELMTAYALTVLVSIVGLTMALLAGYHRYETRVSRYTPYLPTVSAVVLVVMGLGFVAGLL